jgi:uncharacterized protein YebE (UPF0316 family)
VLNFVDVPWYILPVILFFMRVLDMSMDTLRVVSVVHGRKLSAWMFGFYQSIIFVVAITSILSNLDNIWNIFGYAAGFATGNLLGMIIEERMAIGYGNVRIISSRQGNAIAEGLRMEGFALTESSARGKDGTVTVIESSTRRRDIKNLIHKVREIDDEAFIVAEGIRPLHRGFWRMKGSRR